MNSLSTVIDGGGVYGSVFHYALVMAFVGSAFLIFIYFWRKGKLDMDEGPKFQMLQASDHFEHKEDSNE